MASRMESRHPTSVSQTRATERNGAAEGTRTPDPNITNVVLYQLSYCGVPLFEAGGGCQAAGKLRPMSPVIGNPQGICATRS